MIMIAAAFVSLAPVAAGAGEAGVLGLLTPQGTFKPVLRNAPSSGPAPAATAYTGLVNTGISINIISNAAHLNPSTLKCTVNLEIINYDGTYTDTVEENDTIAATVSGSVATCALQIPYYWSLYLGSSDTVQVSYSITGLTASGVGRTSSGSIASIPVPANNTTTTFNVRTKI